MKFTNRKAKQYKTKGAYQKKIKTIAWQRFFEVKQNN